MATPESDHVELATDKEAIVWADLGDNATGELTLAQLTDVSDNITTQVKDNEITVTYTDAASRPYSYMIAVKDDSASGNPKQDGMPVVYDFTQKEVTADVSSLHAKGSSYVIMDPVTSKDKLLTFSNGIYFNDTTHGIGLNDGACDQCKGCRKCNDRFYELCIFKSTGTGNSDSFTGK